MKVSLAERPVAKNSSKRKACYKTKITEVSCHYQYERYTSGFFPKVIHAAPGIVVHTLVAALAGIGTTGRKANPDPNIAIIEKIANIAFEFIFMTCHEPLTDINIFSQFDHWSLGL